MSDFYRMEELGLGQCQTWDLSGKNDFHQLNLLINANDVFRALGNRQELLTYSYLLIKHNADNLNGYVRAAQDLRFLKQFDNATEIFNLGIKNVKEN